MSSDSTTTHPEQTEPRQRIWPISTPDEQEELDSEGSRPGSLLELEVLNDQISKFVSLLPLRFQVPGAKSSPGSETLPAAPRRCKEVGIHQSD